MKVIKIIATEHKTTANKVYSITEKHSVDVLTVEKENEKFHKIYIDHVNRVPYNMNCLN